MKIVTIVTLYNSADIIERCLGTIMGQSYDNFICYIIDDLSTDNSAYVVEAFIKDDKRFTLIRNTEKRYQGGNYDLICRDTLGVDENDIIVEVDGDDWLPSSSVFNRVIHTYNSGDIWIANGSFKYSDGRQGFAQPVTNLTTLRHGPYTASHLRTWKVFLWRAIKPEDLRNSEGKWWSSACDLIFMYDMFELAGLEHYAFMPDINYIYNENNPLNEHKVYMGDINKMKILSVNKIPRKRLIRE
jgi:glycosyltransferase involved in cell wall biosynthesis